MAARKLTRWQKAGALVPMAVLVGAWGAALGNSGLATASGGAPDSDVPAVPATAFEQPASVQQTPQGVDRKAGAAGTVATLSTNGIPSSALAAYRRAETLLGQADEKCKLPWHLVAAIGRVESNHGRTNNNALNTDGLAEPGIYGVPLDGKDGRARITDTDSGALDKNSVYDRAVGPMQFIPGTWKSVGVDSDNDGTKNPQDIDDAATSSGIYLCAGEGDLSDRDDAAAAVKRYNHSDSYVELVLKISAAYAGGDFTKSPDGLSTAPILTSTASDQTLSASERKAAIKAEQKATKKPKPAKDRGTNQGGGTGTGGGTPGAAPVPGGSTPGTGGGGDAGSGGDSAGGGQPTTTPGTIGGGVQDLVEDTPLAPVTKPVTGLLTAVEANLQCTLTVAGFPASTYRDRFKACMAKFGY